MSKRNLIIVLSVCLLAVGAVANVKHAVATTATSMSSIATSTLDVICIQKVVDTRDSAIITAADGYYTSTKSALETRRDALKNAWAISKVKERKVAIKKAWADFTKAQKEAKRKLQKAKSAAWKQYRADRKGCGKQAISDDSAGEGADSQL